MLCNYLPQVFEEIFSQKIHMLNLPFIFFLKTHQNLSNFIFLYPSSSNLFEFASLLVKVNFATLLRRDHLI